MSVRKRFIVNPPEAAFGVGRYRVGYRFGFDATGPLYDKGDTFDLRRDALDHRNWFFGHSPGVVECWIEKDGKPSGAVLRREIDEAARDLDRAIRA